MRIRPATVQGHGKGLFAARDFKKGEVVAHYTGDYVDTEWVEDNADKTQYVLELSEVAGGTYIDAARTNSAEGRMINDPQGTGKRANVNWSANQQIGRAHV